MRTPNSRVKVNLAAEFILGFCEFAHVCSSRWAATIASVGFIRQFLGDLTQRLDIQARAGSQLLARKDRGGDDGKAILGRIKGVGLIGLINVRPTRQSELVPTSGRQRMPERKYDSSRPYIPADIDRIVRTQAGHRCSITFCNEHTYLEIHHIDENRENNSSNNLILLCDKHHKMAHAGKIDKKSLREYKSKLSIQPQLLHPLDARAIQHLKEHMPPDGLILRLKNEEFTGPLFNDLVNAIHSLPYVWQSPYAQFQDADLEKASKTLLERCECLSRTLAQKTFGAKSGGNFYEIPPEYPEERFYNEVGVVRSDAQAVSDAYDSLVRLALSKGFNF